MSNLKKYIRNRLQFICEIIALIYNIFFIHLFYKYFKIFTPLENVCLISFIIGTFIIEIILLFNWNKYELSPN